MTCRFLGALSFPALKDGACRAILVKPGFGVRSHGGPEQWGDGLSLLREATGIEASCPES
jgi:hypothetical protein